MKKLIKFIGILILSTFICSIITLFFCSLLPAPSLPSHSTLRLIDDNMNVFYSASNDTNVDWVELSEVPDTFLNAVISIEDKRFYQHFGIDFLRLAKAAWVNLLAKDIVQGGSTITQQVAKNVYLSQEQTLQRKIKEMLYALRLELHYTKDEILETYINTSYYGHGITGAKTAAQFFYNKPLNECSDAQLILLAGIPNGPVYYSPFNNIENSKNRQKTILQAMHANGLLTLEETQKIAKEPLNLAQFKEQIDKKLDGYYRDAIFKECHELGYCTEEQINTGLDIYTYYNPELQKIIQTTIDETMSDSTQQTAIIALEPYTFNVMAISGGKRYADTQYNRALYSKRQVGSTIKPLLYYIALNQGFQPDTTFLSTRTNFQLTQTVSYTPENYKDLYANTDISLIHAISTSDNIYAIKTHLYLGINMLYDALRAFGIEQKEATASMALGTTDFPLMDLAKIYNTFASEGLVEKPAFIKCIKDSSGKILYQREINLKQLLNQDDTLVLTSLLRAPFDIKNNYVSGPSLLGYEPYTTVAAKSGSSDWDSLVASYNPEMTLILWNGYDENQSLTTTEERKIARVLFQKIWNTLYPKNSPGPWYTPTDNLEIRKVNPITGQLDNNGSIYWFKKRS